jgi:hypothetical protein
LRVELAGQSREATRTSLGSPMPPESSVCATITEPSAEAFAPIPITVHAAHARASASSATHRRQKANPGPDIPKA